MTCAQQSSHSNPPTAIGSLPAMSQALHEYKSKAVISYYPDDRDRVSLRNVGTFKVPDDARENCIERPSCLYKKQKLLLHALTDVTNVLL
jgi:hypothetical protein